MVYRPAALEELADIVAQANVRKETLAVTGSSSKPGLGPGKADAVLDLTGITGSIVHDPGELLLTVPASTPLANVKALLAGSGQCLAFEPPSPQAIWNSGCGTIGGAIACGWSGPRRPFAGAARDHVLGLSGVTGRGEVFRAGGKVLKNVTGFDLPRLLAGSRGTLAIMTELTLKVLPLPPAQATLRFPAVTVADAVQLMAAALMHDQGITGAAWVDGMVLLRIESTVTALPAMLEAAQKRLTGGDLIDHDGSCAIWERAATPANEENGELGIWRCPLPASRAAAFAALLPAGATVQMDWGGALVWAVLPSACADFDVHTAIARVAGRDGHAERVCGPAAAAERAVAARTLPDPALAALLARVKAQFDPAGILSPATLPGGAA